MGKIGTIFRREFRAYFTGPVGYIFLSAFLLFTNLLALFIVQRFFEFPMADLRPYFHVLAGVGSFLVAAVTMRLWSEDRKENTYELLLTLPVTERDLVLGKFLAAFAFYAVGLVLTLPVPVMMIVASKGAATGWSGLLDPGAAASGYLGALLCGALFVSFGLFVSGLCRDQVVAFVLTAPALFFAYILGIPWVRQSMNAALDAAGPGLGEQAGRVVGVFHHYDNLARGLVDLGDVLFFLVWTALFLFLNMLTAERRGKSGASMWLAVASVLVFGIGAMGNWLLSDVSLARFDATADRVFTVSPVSARVLGRMENNLRVRYHVSPREKLPEEMRQMERDLADKLDALRLASKGKLAYEVVLRTDIGESETADPEAAPGRETPSEGKDAQDELKSALYRKIQPFPVAVSGADRESVQLVYSALELVMDGSDKEPEVIGMVVPSSMGGYGADETSVAQVEYRLVTYVNRLTRERAPTVAFVSPVKPQNPQLAQLFLSMGRQPPPPEDPFGHLASILESWENYQVRRVRIEQNDPIPAEADALVVIAPDRLNDRQRYEIARAAAGGMPVLLATQTDRYDYGVTMSGYEGTRVMMDPNLDGILPPGVKFADGMVFDRAKQTFSMKASVPSALGRMTYPFPPWPMHVVLSGDSLAYGDPVFDQVTKLRWPWGNAFTVDASELSAAGLSAKTLIRANPTAELRSPRRTLTNNFLKFPEGPLKAEAERPVLGMRIEGTFPFAFAERPKWEPAENQNPYGPPPPPPEEEGEAPPLEAKPGKMILLGDAWLWSREGLDLTPPYSELTFFLNAVGSLALSAEDLDLRALRDKHETRRFIQAMDEGAKTRWKVVQVAGPVLLLALVGVGVCWWRKIRRDRYERMMN